MKEALYRLLIQTPIKIEFSNSQEDGKTIDVEKYFKKRHIESRDDYREIGIEIDGVSGSDPGFFDQLDKNGVSFALK